MRWRLDDGSLLLAGEPVSTGRLPDLLQARLAQHGEELELRVRSDRRVPYRVIEPVLTGAARAGLWNVTFAVIRREDAS